MRSLVVLLLSITLLAASCGDDGGSAAEWCDLANEVDALEGLGGEDPADWRQFQDVINDAADAAPSEIADDVQLTADFLDAMVDALDDNDDNIILAFDEVVLSDDIDQDELDAAGDRIEAYNDENCDGDGADSDVTDPEDSDSDNGDSDAGGDAELPEGGIVASIAASLGIPEEDARCILENVDLDSGGEPDPTQIFDALTTCDIDPLSIAGG